MKYIKEKYKFLYSTKCDSHLFFNDKKIYYNYYGDYTNYGNNSLSIFHKLDGPHRICFNNEKIVYKEFWVNDRLILNYKNFAKETNHLICEYCNDFCKQECF